MLPSKKFIIVILIILLAGAGFFALIKGKNLGKGNKIVFQKQESPSIFQQNKENSDWEEVLLKAGVYTDINASSDETIDTNSESISETEKLSRNFLSQYLNLKLEKGGENLDEETKQGLINFLMENIDTGIQIASYSLSDLKISPDNSKEAVRDYGEQLSQIFQSHTNPGLGDELLLWGEMVEKNDESMTTALDKIVTIYEKLKKDSLALSVPQEIKDQHLKLVNTLALLEEISARFRDYFKDPLAGLVAAGQYQKAVADYVDSLTEINNYLKTK